MTLDSQLVGGGQTGGAAADDGDALAGGRSNGGGEGVLGLHVVVGSKCLQVSDGQGLLHQLAAAVGLTGVGADTAHGSGQGNLVLDDADGLTVVAQGDLLDVALHIGVGGAAQVAGTLAVAVVVGHQQLQGDLAGLDSTLGLGIDLPAVGSDGGAGAHQLGQTLTLDDTDAAGAVVLDLGQVAQGGDENAVGVGDLQDGLTLLADTFLAIDNQLDFTHWFGLLIPRQLRPCGRS